jgi:hypothetical protein
MSKWVVVLAMVVGGCSNSNNNGDMGVGDMGLPDLSIVTPPDLSAPMVLTGSRILPGRVSLAGVTTDDFVIVQDDMSGALKAVPVAGGTAQTILAVADFFVISGKVVFAWEALNADGVGKIYAWTPAGGSVLLGNTSYPRGAAASDDGTFVLFNDNANLDASLVDFYVAKSDGTGKVALTGIDRKIGETPCRPRSRFAGAHFFISTCSSAGDAGISPATIHSVTTTGTVATLLTDARGFFTVDKAGTKVLGIVDMPGTATVIPAAGGTAIPIDSAVTDAEITSDGATVVYAKGGALMKSPSGSAAPVSLVGSGCRILDGISPNDQFVACHDVAAMTGQDLLVASLAAPGTPVTISNMPDIALFGSLFTSDSSRVLYYTDLDQDEAGTLNAQPVAGGAPAVLSTDKVWLSYGAAGSKVLYNDGWRTVSMAGRANLKVIDGAGGTPTLIATQADDSPALSNDKGTAIFTYRAAAGKEGLYAAPIQ